MLLIDYLKAWPQYVMPGHLLSRLMYALTRVRIRAFKNLFIDTFIRLYKVDMQEAVEQNPHAYEHFNAFFTRALRPEARPLADGAGAIACPVDGSVSQTGTIADGSIFQAKGHSYSTEELLGGSRERAAPFHNGSFATLYLAPSNYHRIHMPFDGRLTGMVHVPGRLFSVSPATARAIPQLFARNERVVALFETDVGPMAVVMVGAVFVASIETVWARQVTPPAGRIIRQWSYPENEAPCFARGDEIGRFNMGSTVIVLFGPDAVNWTSEIGHGSGVCMGQLLGKTQR
nr:archaetidylserine decarboxylase [Thiohalomonas denitrificans]